MAKKRDRPRISIDVSETEMAAIDQAKGRTSRASFCHDRIVHSNGFADPSFGVCAAILGKLAVISEDRWGPLDKVLELMRLAEGLSQSVAISSSNLANLESRLGSIQADLTQLSSTAREELRAIEALLELASKFVPFEALEGDPFSDLIKPNWHRTDT
jgi:hypothetical protein